ncbi:MAG: AmmeMemoRadiSam system protein A [Bifidobacteriaceae bacterium]|jgi:AmmeMemoRadiSam system protein A|nr:AmmeMemoRadiSam system protein A [Bifidobacteriaceae bacterium]
MPELPGGAGPILTALARDAIVRGLGMAPRARPAEPEWLAHDGASFVTLTIGGRLRGCIGTLEAHRPLGEDVRSNARSAAFRDPRFPPLAAAESERLRIEVSVLSEPAPIDAASEADALAQLVPGDDGVILQAAGRRATFLPQVWNELPDPAEFLAHLKRKAGLPAGYWGDARLWRYSVAAFQEGAGPGSDQA